MSFRDSVRHRNDKLKHRGYDYRGNIFKNSLSSAFFLEGKRSGILLQMETMLVFLIDQVKHIKKTFHYGYEKNFRDFN